VAQVAQYFNIEPWKKYFQSFTVSLVKVAPLAPMRGVHGMYTLRGKIVLGVEYKRHNIGKQMKHAVESKIQPCKMMTISA